MSPNKPTLPPTSSAAKPTPYERLIAALTKRLEADGEPKHAGVMMDYQGRGIDDGGGYSDPHIDTRPDFLKQDDEGWTPLK